LKCASCRKTSRPKLISTSESAAHLGTRNRLRQIAQQFQNWLKNRCEKWRVPVLDAPEGRRDDFVDPHFKQAMGRVPVLKPRAVVAGLWNRPNRY
jgi:hypothetical protein